MVEYIGAILRQNFGARRTYARLAKVNSSQEWMAASELLNPVTHFNSCTTLTHNNLHIMFTTLRALMFTSMWMSHPLLRVVGLLSKILKIKCNLSVLVCSLWKACTAWPNHS